MAGRKSNKATGIVSLCLFLAVAVYLAFFKESRNSVPSAAPVEVPGKSEKGPGLKPLRELQVFSGKVIGVKDGDTFEILYDGQPERVRLAEIDCPEKSQPFGNNAKQYASDLCFGQQVTVTVHGKRDRYGRIVGTVVTSDGVNVNEALVKAGLAWHYKQYSDSETLAAMEQQARLQQDGLWADKKPTPPWEWRKNKRKHKRRANAA